MKTIITIAVIAIAFGASFAANEKDLKRLIFEEQKIEGKIRRPQLVLIKADERPAFKPMAIQSLGENDNFTRFVSSSVLEQTPYSGPFNIEAKRITNYVP